MIYNNITLLKHQVNKAVDALRNKKMDLIPKLMEEAKKNGVDVALVEKAKQDAEKELERIKIRDELNKALEASDGDKMMEILEKVSVFTSGI